MTLCDTFILTAQRTPDKPVVSVSSQTYSAGIVTSGIAKAGPGHACVWPINGIMSKCWLYNSTSDSNL